MHKKRAFLMSGLAFLLSAGTAMLALAAPVANAAGVEDTFCNRNGEGLCLSNREGVGNINADKGPKQLADVEAHGVAEYLTSDGTPGDAVQIGTTADAWMTQGNVELLN